MAILVDTSVLGRLANRADVAHWVARNAIAELHRRGETLHLAPQNLVEFRNFATRPVKVNGLGLTASAADGLGKSFEAAFSLLAETPDIYPAWKSFLSGRLASSVSKFMTPGSWRSATPTGCRTC
ncbi:MAG TPA: hypothetical protein DDY78_26345 [Planctomycetales bacterium]|jgi:predicted nucleic acid-binding protein|nr:hypothetical protein [Planctomycetales bacterium]